MKTFVTPQHSSTSALREQIIGTYSSDTFRMVNILKWSALYVGIEYVLLCHLFMLALPLLQEENAFCLSIFKLVIYEFVPWFMGSFSHCQPESNFWTSQHAYTFVSLPRLLGLLELEKFD